MKKFLTMAKSKMQQAQQYQGNTPNNQNDGHQNNEQQTWQQTLIQQHQQQQNYQEAPNNQDRDDQEDQYQDDTQQTQQPTSTTAGGDGLEFNPYVQGIFDEIEQIKETFVAVSPSKQKLKNQDDIALEDIPEEVTPATILLEVVKSMEDLKQSAIRVTRQEEEFDHVLKALKRNQAISTCSMTLELMIHKLKASQEQTQEFRVQVDATEKEKYDLQQQLSEVQIQYEESQTKLTDVTAELYYYVEENKRLQQVVDRMKKQKEENIKLHDDERTKIHYDNQRYKDKLELIKVELYEARKRIGELNKYSEIYESMKEKEAERTAAEIERKVKEEIANQKEIKTINYHLKSNLFAEETASYMTMVDIARLICTSKKVQGTFLKYNSRIFISHCAFKINEMSNVISDYENKCQVQDIIIRRHADRDHMRQMLVQEVGDERIKYIIEKHVIRPQLAPTSNNTAALDMERSLKTITHFVASYFEMVQKIYQAQQQQIQKEQQALQQQAFLKEQAKLNISQGSIENGGGSMIANAGKKLVGAFSGFGFRKRKDSKLSMGVDSSLQVSQDVQTQPDSQQNNNDNNQNVIQEETKQEEQSQHKEQQDQPLIEQNQQQINTNEQQFEEDNLVTTDNSSLLDNTTDVSNENLLDRQQLYEQNLKVINNQTLEQLPSGEEVEETKSDSQSQNNSRSSSSSSLPFIQNVEVPEQTLKGLDQISSKDDMNELLFRIGSYLVNDKGKLSKWIQGLQQGFAEFYVISKQLYVETKELELLKDFFTSRIETLKLRVHELLNEKEDMMAIHQSDLQVKEHLIAKMNDLDKSNVERVSEMLHEKRRVQELLQDKQAYDERMSKIQIEVQEFKIRNSKEAKQLREVSERLTEENVAFKKVIDDLKIFFNKVSTE